MSSTRIALTTYSVKPRGGVVHTLELAEALSARGADVTVVALAEAGRGFFRPTAVPVHLVESPPPAPTLEERVFDSIAALTDALRRIGPGFDIVHSQDCISARAAARVRDAGAGFRLIRTVHHVDDFTTQALIDCQRAAIEEPDEVLVVSELWRRLLAEEYDVPARVVTNGVRADRFAGTLDAVRRKELRAEIGAEDRFLYLTIGGIEPRKGSRHLVDALARLRHTRPDPPMLAVIGGHSFQDYRAYREEVLGGLEAQGLALGRDLVLLGTLSDDAVVDWLHAADGFAFPSLKEGWGLVILEAMAAGLPVVSSDLEVFGEFLTPDVDAVMTRAGDDADLAAGLARLLDEPATRTRLADHGPRVAARYSWANTADQHLRIYRGS
ncbi:MSMEG_0565 family glycosyltransferase [Nocardioides sp. LMS-CY]|uniref:MSMEG_0565 family glycosyltransferase n=1 Tax=Nocardioides sp. (strain LMS-CY) TaxID=2840457 RepID=UPI001BFFF116|nr:MSMEG_0565 family glycosyltransferase [Nocardioides sp. LMS-CY]QWF23135.1 MSMEG_0565 family glycosyltransferase [Nocardioides sp. LMS-CY]